MTAIAFKETNQNTQVVKNECAEALFCLVLIKKRSFWISCVFWFITILVKIYPQPLSASWTAVSHLCSFQESEFTLPELPRMRTNVSFRPALKQLQKQRRGKWMMVMIIFFYLLNILNRYWYTHASLANQFKAPQGWSFEACCQWGLLIVQIINYPTTYIYCTEVTYILSFCNYMNENFENDFESACRWNYSIGEKAWWNNCYTMQSLFVAPQWGTADWN